MKLNGWQRLWVLFSAIYSIFIISFVILDFPQAEDVPHRSDFYKKLSKKSAMIIWPTTHEDTVALGFSISELYKKTIGSSPSERVESNLPDYVLKALQWRDYEVALKNSQNKLGKLKEVRRTWKEYKKIIKKLPAWAKPIGNNYETIEMPNKHLLRFFKKTSNADILLATEEYFRIVEQKIKEKRLSLVLYAFLFWTLPCILLYIFGSSICWVYRGFKKNENAQ